MNCDLRGGTLCTQLRPPTVIIFPYRNEYRMCLLRHKSQCCAQLKTAGSWKTSNIVATTLELANASTIYIIMLWINWYSILTLLFCNLLFLCQINKWIYSQHKVDIVFNASANTWSINLYGDVCRYRIYYYLLSS